MSYPGHLLKESYPSAQMQSVYSTSPADWATYFSKKQKKKKKKVTNELNMSLPL